MKRTAKVKILLSLIMGINKLSKRRPNYLTLQKQQAVFHTHHNLRIEEMK